MNSIGVFIFGINAESALQKAVQSSITTEKPAQMPRLKGTALLNPLRLALDMDRMLLGPGVAAVTTAYVKNENQLNMFDFPPKMQYDSGRIIPDLGISFIIYY